MHMVLPFLEYPAVGILDNSLLVWLGILCCLMVFSTKLSALLSGCIEVYLSVPCRRAAWPLPAVKIRNGDAAYLHMQVLQEEGNRRAFLGA